MKKHNIFYLFLLIIIGLFGFGCGNKENSGNKITTAIRADIDSLNPYKMVSSATKDIMMNVYEGLVIPSADGGIEPALASKFDISDDGLVYTFKVRDNVKFHDGKVLTCEDVKYSLERASGKDEDKIYNSSLLNIKSIEIKNNNILEIVLKQPDNTFIYNMIIPIVPVANKDNLENNPIGTGPYKVLNYEKERKIELVKNHDYYGESGNIENI